MQPNFSIVVCAGGKSSRFRSAGGATSKLFVEWQNRPLFIHTLKCFSMRPPQELVLVVPEEEISVYQQHLQAENLGYPLKIVSGGARRQDSVRFGLEALAACEFVGIHDGARPFVSFDLMDRMLQALPERGALIPVVELVDTIKEIDGEGKVLRSLDRSRVVRVQTPQFFEYKKILEVHRSLAKSSQEFTDDSMMWESFGYPVYTLRGELGNIKVTRPEDLITAGIK